MLLYDKKVTSHFVGDPSLAKARLLSAQLADAPSQKVRLRSLTLSLLRMTHKGETGANILIVRANIYNLFCMKFFGATFFSKKVAKTHPLHFE